MVANDIKFQRRQDVPIERLTGEQHAAVEQEEWDRKMESGDLTQFTTASVQKKWTRYLAFKDLLKQRQKLMSQSTF
jgi:hypothetical protein